MILECIATGSSGNCYILQADTGERLVLDAGISISRLKQAIDFDIKTLRGCLITIIRIMQDALMNWKGLGHMFICPMI